MWQGPKGDVDYRPGSVGHLLPGWTDSRPAPADEQAVASDQPPSPPPPFGAGADASDGGSDDGVDMSEMPGFEELEAAPFGVPLLKT